MWESLIGAGASLLGGALGSSSAKKAAEAQAQSAREALGEQQRQYNTNRQDLMPFMDAGRLANDRLASALGLTSPSNFAKARDQYIAKVRQANPGISENWVPSDSAIQQYAESNGMGGTSDGELLRRFSADDLNADPVYQSGLKFGLDQGTEAINNRAIAGGGYDSGATLKALTRYANDYGSTKANDSYNRFNTDQTNTYNRLAGVSGTGQQATNQVISSGTGLSNNMANTMTDSGNARAAGIIGGANAWGDALGGVTNAANNYGTSQWLKSLTTRRPGTYSGTDITSNPNMWEFG